MDLWRLVSWHALWHSWCEHQTYPPFCLYLEVLSTTDELRRMDIVDEIRVCGDCRAGDRHCRGQHAAEEEAEGLCFSR